MRGSKNIKVLNIDEGKNLKLVALLTTGEMLGDEVSIVNGWCDKLGKISQIFLVKFDFDCEKLRGLNYVEKYKILEMMSIRPVLADVVKKAISKADTIIYGSGTQFSSLLPSYLIINDYISRHHKDVNKFFIPNLDFDNALEI